MNITWHRRYIQMAGLVAQWSKDPSTKVGCILVNPASQVVVATGFNGFARGIEERNMVEEPDKHGSTHLYSDGLNSRWLTRPEKYLWVEHAERNAIYNAARNGQATLGTIAYMNYNPHCICPDCARAIIQAGIIQVIGPNRAFPGKGIQWMDELQIAEQMLQEAGVGNLTVEDAR